MHPYGVFALLAAVLPSLAQPSLAQPALPESAIDQVATKVLSETGVPSASIAVVRNGNIYVQAYGDARLNPKTPASPEMRYKIASNSKQIAAAAILLLAEEHKLSLDDKVSRFLPTLTRSNEVTLRQLLSHTSGYEDYYPLDYVAPFMALDTTPQQIVDQWAKKPLNFDPGTKWQYSNTDYVIIGQIVEKLTGKPLIDFLRSRIFAPLTARDLALWDGSLLDGKILKPEALKALTTEVRLKDGAGTHYAFGLSVSTTALGKRRWSHSGGASGFVSRNTIFPDDRASVTVLTNGEGDAAGAIAPGIEELLFAPAADPGAASALDGAKKLFTGLQDGKLDRSLITGDLSAYFSDEAIAGFAASLKPLGPPERFTEAGHDERGGMTSREFSVRTASKSLLISAFLTTEEKFAQFLVSPAPTGR